jgi:hypothetical protein
VLRPKYDLLNSLVATAPAWTTINARNSKSVEFTASPNRTSGRPTRPYSLLATLDGRGAISVQERDSIVLPSFCPQRHINENGSFCLGFRAGAVTDETGCAKWWNKLRVFLLCQEVASSTGEWPEGMQISHGDAGEIELEAEEVAESLGLRAIYEEAVRYGTGPIAYFAKRVRAGRLLNGRAACVCGRLGRRNRLQLRRECWAQKQPCLPILERQRQEAESRFWADLARRKKVCCQTMSACPLRGERL